MGQLPLEQYLTANSRAVHPIAPPKADGITIVNYIAYPGFRLRAGVVRMFG